ncbi:unnamed protein product, partial [Fusarium equiseti]
MEYRVLTDPDNVGLEQAFETQSPAFEKALRRTLEKATPDAAGEELIAEEDQE